MATILCCICIYVLPPLCCAGTLPYLYLYLNLYFIFVFVFVFYVCICIEAIIFGRICICVLPPCSAVLGPFYGLGLGGQGGFVPVTHSMRGIRGRGQLLPSSFDIISFCIFVCYCIFIYVFFFVFSFMYLFVIVFSNTFFVCFFVF